MGKPVKRRRDRLGRTLALLDDGSSGGRAGESEDDESRSTHGVENAEGERTQDEAVDDGLKGASCFSPLAKESAPPRDGAVRPSESGQGAEAFPVGDVGAQLGLARPAAPGCTA